MTLSNEIAFGVIWKDKEIDSNFQVILKTLKMSLCPTPDNKSESGGEFLGSEKGPAHTLYSGSL